MQAPEKMVYNLWKTLQRKGWDRGGSRGTTIHTTLKKELKNTRRHMIPLKEQQSIKKHMIPRRDPMHIRKKKTMQKIEQGRRSNQSFWEYEAHLLNHGVKLLGKKMSGDFLTLSISSFGHVKALRIWFHPKRCKMKSKQNMLKWKTWNGWLKQKSLPHPR